MKPTALLALVAILWVVAPPLGWFVLAVTLIAWAF